ncbi:MAG: hypothetical protein ACYTHN_15900 [Planctomycetota bacterium]|jgi:hypothetical protein
MKFALFLLIVLVLVFQQGCISQKMSTEQKVASWAALGTGIAGLSFIAASGFQHPQRNRDICFGIGVSLDVLTTLFLTTALKKEAGKREEDE